MIEPLDPTLPDLPDPSASSDPLGPEPERAVLLLEGREEIRDACLRLAEQARRELLIFARELDPEYFDRAPFLAAVRRLALESPQLPVRALVFEPKGAVLAGHRLIELSRHLSSRIGIRRVSDDDRERLDAFLIADARGYCLRQLADRHQAKLEWEAPREARLLKEEFERMWERASPDTELRRLYL
jgi:hypothetical protein